VSYSLPVAGGAGGVAWTVKPFADGFNWTEQSVTVTSSSVSGINFSSPTTVTVEPPQQQQGAQNSLFNVNDNKSKVALVLPAGALGSGTGNVTVTTKRNSGAPETANFKPLGGKSVEISIKREDGQGINNLQSGATISIDYSDLGSTLTLAQRQALQAVYWDETANEWVVIEGCTNDTTAMKFTCSGVTHLTQFSTGSTTSTTTSTTTPTTPARAPPPRSPS